MTESTESGVAGGQGHSGAHVERSAMVIVWMLAGAFAWTVGALLWSLIR